MTSEIDRCRRAAKRLKKAHAAGEAEALARAAAVLPPERLAPLRHVDALHVIAREEGAESWPRLKLRIELHAATPEQRLRRLREALENGFHWAVREVLAVAPDLARADPGVAAALYDLSYWQAALAADREAATREIEGAPPLCHLAFSRWVHGDGTVENMRALAELLLAHGADVNAGKPEPGGSGHMLSPLYGAIGHGNNMALGRWLLDHGADPNDGESLYHATELGHTDGLTMLLEAGAKNEGTNALLRALDFEDIEPVRMLLAAGADPNEGVAAHPSGEPPMKASALHQAARRMRSGAVARLLIEAGASLTAPWDGRSPYATARVFGNAEVAQIIAEAGGETPLSGSDGIIAEAAEGRVPTGRLVPEELSPETRTLLRGIIHLPGALPRVKALVAAGMEWDRSDDMGVPPVQIAGWEGLSEIMAFLLSLGPDLEHKNQYGGDLLGTTLHGTANAPDRAVRDHLGCVRLALEAGLPLYRGYLLFTGSEEIAGVLADYAEAHPERVVDNL
ncbi:ankyrin repeat domain-containing protein [Vannielia litorea]|uniref:ankyrin repeat domain-containing protein n=1 Tax=Vannielia litorea TaxID=1217970 RepID=UPI001C96CC5F|nr:ankyrin repeat domain-containing protein [Vannielia litorea]MBY6049722.1 ankyrin repeat domain-containing protein [Vannielia litorea]MBY6077136.1 ankyrin repeat domain-containing protein [Vannielia litorea]